MTSVRPRRTASGGRWWWAAPILTPLLVLSAMPALVRAQGETAEFEGRIEARRLSSGRVEFGNDHQKLATIAHEIGHLLGLAHPYESAYLVVTNVLDLHA